MMGSTQLEEEITYDLSDISENHSSFIAAHLEEEPPQALNYDKGSEKFWLEITYVSEGTVKFSDYVKLAAMVDRQNSTPDEESREKVYWPE
jgi:hypothetical protein